MGRVVDERPRMPTPRCPSLPVLVYCPETDRVYALDIEEVASSNCVLRVDPTANGQAKRIRWAADHKLPA